jgi:hypothetical protein
MDDTKWPSPDHTASRSFQRQASGRPSGWRPSIHLGRPHNEPRLRWSIWSMITRNPREADGVIRKGRSLRLFRGGPCPCNHVTQKLPDTVAQVVAAEPACCVRDHNCGSDWLVSWILRSGSLGQSLGLSIATHLRSHHCRAGLSICRPFGCRFSAHRFCAIRASANTSHYQLRASSLQFQFSISPGPRAPTNFGC